jgi:hypothetical protein
VRDGQIAIGRSADGPNGLTRLGHLLRSMVHYGGGKPALVRRAWCCAKRERVVAAKKSKKKREIFQRGGKEISRDGRTGSRRKGDGSGSEALPSATEPGPQRWEKLARAGPTRTNWALNCLQGTSDQSIKMCCTEESVGRGLGLAAE